MLARLAKPHFWHEVAVLLGGPIAMSLFSMSIARLVEHEEGPVIPPLRAPGVSHRTRSEIEGGSLPKASVKDLSNSGGKREEEQSSSGGFNEQVDGNEPSKTMHLIFAFS